MSLRSSDVLEELGENFKFPKNFGDEVVFTMTHQWGHEDVTETLKSKVGGLKPDEPRKVTMDIYSWLGSIGAVHHYVKLDLGYLNYVYASNGKPYNKYHGSHNHTVPVEARWLEMEIMRRADKRDIKHDKDMADMSGESFLYGRMQLGDWTHDYWSEDEAREAGIKFFKDHFEPGWILVDKYFEDDDKTQKVYARS